MTLGDQDDIATRLKFRAGIDTGTWRSYARLGFRYVLCIYVCVVMNFDVRIPDGHEPLPSLLPFPTNHNHLPPLPNL